MKGGVCALSDLGIPSNEKDPASGMQLKVLFPCLKQAQY